MRQMRQCRIGLQALGSFVSGTLLAILFGGSLTQAINPDAWGFSSLIWKLYRSPDGQFSLHYPETWLIRPLGGHGVAFVAPDMPQTEFTYGYGFHLPRPMTIFEANIWWLRMRQTQFSGYGILDQRQIAEGNAYYGLDVLARFPVRGFTYSERYVIYIMRQGQNSTANFLNVYFTYRAPLPEYVHLELDLFLPMVESIQRPPVPPIPIF